MTTKSNHQHYKTALFVCFGGMSNVGVLTGLAGLEVMKQVGRENACIFCLGGLPTHAPSVLEKTHQVQRVVTVDGCHMNCARQIVEQAGFTPHHSLTLEDDCGIAKKSSLDYTEANLHTAAQAILQIIQTDAV
jgi:uncharacterized metal-binding protein